ncbi:peptidoglycan-binding protein [Streptomyces sp. TLI_171]|uniref:peptidoglycan-binding domain-containing protein n=1 Tax=Streptomyces sp. TLI_171 TaxID=1938859 RepID=UPI000C1A84A3|nr:peptidoglycan-binding domain-containing protein [Streptomyces sp. TLI_171]RKE23418.1 putative peptidoglycan binding protein [Streptomyces sp. TLI_171]
MRLLNSRATTLLATAAAALLLGGLTAAPASASNSYNGAAYINGSGDAVDDLYDEGVLSTTQNARSNATCFWQMILWANDMGVFKDHKERVDGVFGSDTAAATRQFQSAYGLNADGAVGKATFKAAEDGDKGMFPSYGSTPTTYAGTTHSFWVTRDSSGHYHFKDRTGADRAAGYDYLTCA